MQTYSAKKYGHNIRSRKDTNNSAERSIPNSLYAGEMPQSADSGLESALKNRVNSSVSYDKAAAENALSSLHSHERQMSDDLSDSLTDRFGVDMHGMRIFEDEGLQERFGQRAYAMGNEIHLSAGEYSPHTSSGLELIMHEAGHVVQQGSGMVHSRGITENAALEAHADSGFAAPESFSMPVAGESSAIQGRLSWQKLKSLFSRRRGEGEAPAQEEPAVQPEALPEEEAPQPAQEVQQAENAAPVQEVKPEPEPQQEAEQAPQQEALPETQQEPQGRHSRLSRGWERFTTGASKAWNAVKWGTRAVAHGVRNLGKKALDTFGLIDSHVQAVDQLNNYRKDYNNMSRWERFKWTMKNPLARMFAHSEQKNTDRRNLEEQLVSEELASNSISAGSNDAKPFEAADVFGSQDSGANASGALSKASDAAGKLDGVGKLAGIGAIPVGLGGSTGMNAKEKGVTLGTSDYAFEGAASGISVASDLMGLANNTVQTCRQIDNGNDAEAAKSGLSTAANLSDLLGHGMRFASNVAGKADKVGLADTQIMPGVDVASGVLNAAKGIVGYKSADSTEQAMDERLRSGMEQDSPMFRASMMARSKAHIDKVQGGFDITSGALRASGGALKLGGVTSLVGTAVSGIGSGVGFVGGCVTDEMKSEMRTGVVNDELELDKMASEYSKAHGCDEYTAKRVILRSMGYQSGRRKEVFNNIALNRAAALKQKADSGDEDAVKFMGELGLKPNVYEKDGKQYLGYSLQGIAEKLGMESNATWEKQLSDSRSRRKISRDNPFQQLAQAAKKKEVANDKKTV